MATPNTRPSRKAWTYRVENIPSGTTVEELKGYFHPDDRNHIIVKSLFPSVDIAESEDGDSTATIYFRPPPDVSQAAPRLIDDSVSLDREFLGFTPLYVPSTGRKPIVADIIAVTGLAGHAYGSWAHTPERMWLRDYLPKDAPNARILTYGYPSKLQGNASTSILSDHASTFVHRLIDIRVSAQCEDRPIIFIGHSLGCLIIKKALTDVGQDGLNSSRIPVQAIIFLAAPHRGLNIDALQTLVKGEATEQLILELRAESPTLRDINQRFAYLARDIDILTCYETQPTNTAILVDGLWKREGAPVMMVTPDSASQYYPREKRVPGICLPSFVDPHDADFVADVNHSQIAKIMKGESGIYPNIKSAIRFSLVTMTKIVTQTQTNPTFSPNIEEVVNGMRNSTLDNATIRSSPSPLLGGLGTPGTTVQEINPREISPLKSPDSMKSPEISFEEQHYLDIRIESPKLTRPTTISASTGTSFSISSGDEGNRRPSGTLNSEAVKSYIACGSSCHNDIPITELFYVCDNCGAFVCQKCFSEAPRCPKSISHKLVKSITLMFPRAFRTIPYPDYEVGDSDSQIIRALKLGNLETLNFLAPKRIRNEPGQETLHLAAQLGLVQGMRVLLRYEPNIEYKNMQNETPLMFAVMYDHPEIVEILLEHRANPNKTGGLDSSSTALNIAASCCQSEIIGILLKYNANVNAMSSYGTPLCQAASRGDITSVRLLIDGGANLNSALPSTKRTPLLISAYYGNCDVLELLLRYSEVKKSSLDTRDTDGKTPLFAAVEKGRSTAAKILLDADANPNVKCGPKGDTVLMTAARASNSKLVKLLLGYKVNVNELNFRGSTALMHATMVGSKEICKQLLDRFADLNICKSERDTTAIMQAAAKGSIEIFELFLQYGAEINRASGDGFFTPLSCAAQEGRVEMVKFLLDRHASASPPRAIKTWKALCFNPSVNAAQQREILQILNSEKHSQSHR